MSETPPEVSSGVESKYGILSRTWELELLVSGAVFFSLLQVPALIDQTYSRIEPHLSTQVYYLGFYGYIYSKAIVFVLIGSFLTHLASRAYWVGLVGLDSVFPEGIKWDRFSRYGPVARTILRERVRTLPQTIATIDNFCSVIFGFAFVVVFMFLFSVFVASFATALSWPVHRIFPRMPVQLAFTAVFLTVAFYSMVLVLIDKRFSSRMTPGGRSEHALRRLLGFSIVRVLSVAGTGMITLFSNVPRRVMRPVFFGVLAVTFTLVFVSTYLQRTQSSSLGQWFIPSQRSMATVDYLFYENHIDHPDARTPTIQSDVITEPYVRLLIPYYARRDNDAIARACPRVDARQIDAEEGTEPNPAAVNAVLQCVATLRDIKLDDAPLTGAQLHLYRDPRTGLNGFVTYVSTNGMTRGRHVLTVRQIPREDDNPKAALPPYRIWFWI